MPFEKEDLALIEACSQLSVNRNNGRRAVHKPLLVLLALADIQRGGDGRLKFNSVASPLEELLNQFTNHPGTRAHPHYPFWYLQWDGIWEIDSTAALRAALENSRSREPPISAFRELNPTGGFRVDVASRLRARPDLVEGVANRLLENTFPESRYQEVLDAVGLSFSNRFERTARHPAFRRDVLREYNYACAVCGFDGKIGAASVALEAAHIRMIAFSGDNQITNGIAMCSLHHKLFDFGCFTITDDWKIIVSPLLVGGSEAIVDFITRPLAFRLPARNTSWPAISNLAWHRKELFVDRDR
jgi:putative restriction endonuclease